MLSGQPIIILKENVERNYGKEAQRSNIAAAKAIAGAVRSTLGPRGMDKMLVSASPATLLSLTMARPSSARSRFSTPAQRW